MYIYVKYSIYMLKVLYMVYIYMWKISYKVVKLNNASTIPNFSPIVCTKQTKNSGFEYYFYSMSLP